MVLFDHFVELGAVLADDNEGIVPEICGFLLLQLIARHELRLISRVDYALNLLRTFDVSLRAVQAERFLSAWGEVRTLEERSC